MPAPDLPAVLRPLRDAGRRAALFCDFDGTLAPIVTDPAGAAPLPGAAGVLEALGRRLGMVAVVSGRPVAYLRRALGETANVRLAGLYGMEVAEGSGPVTSPPELAPFRAVVAEVARQARSEAPAGAVVEDKGLTLTLHWRAAPEAESWATAFAEEAARRRGLSAEPGRCSLELRPPGGADKGTVVRTWGPGHAAVACFGDDLGDLPAFRALGELAAGGVAVARVAVVDAESPPEVAAAADLLVEGPAGALDLLARLADATSVAL